MVDMSPTAELVLRRLQAEPDRLRYDLEVFGGVVQSEQLAMLDSAYEQLGKAGLVERSGSFIRFFGMPKRLSERGRSLSGSMP